MDPISSKIQNYTKKKCKVNFKLLFYPSIIDEVVHNMFKQLLLSLDILKKNIFLIPGFQIFFHHCSYRHRSTLFGPSGKTKPASPASSGFAGTMYWGLRTTDDVGQVAASRRERRDAGATVTGTRSGICKDRMNFLCLSEPLHWNMDIVYSMATFRKPRMLFEINWIVLNRFSSQSANLQASENLLHEHATFKCVACTDEITISTITLLFVSMYCFMRGFIFLLWSYTFFVLFLFTFFRYHLLLF